MPSRSPLRATTLLGLAGLSAVGCFKSLDESRIEATGGVGAAGSGGTSATGGVGAAGGTTGGGGSGGTSAGGGGADSGADAGGTSGGGGSGGGSPDASDASDGGGIIAYDPKKYPVTNLGSGPAPVIIGADDSSVFRTTKNAIDSVVVSQPTAGGSGTTLPSMERPQALGVGAGYLFVAGGRNTTTEGSINRVPKAGGLKEAIGLGSPIGLAVGLHVAADGFVYVSVNAVNPNDVGLLRFPVTSTTAQSLYTSTAGGETSGDVVMQSGCVYWISNGAIWVATTSGGSRASALTTAVSDAVGLTADPKSFYFTRANGSVWRRALSSSACDGAGPAEVELSAGFLTLGDLINYDGKLAFTALGDKAQNYAGGGVFMLPTGGGAVTQIAPSDLGPIDIEPSGAFVVYATDLGPVRKLLKLPQN